MLYYALVFVFNFFFNIFKTLEIKYTYENKIKELMLNSIYINIVSLAATFFSIERLFQGDYLVVPFFIAGSVVGKWFAMKHVSKFKRKVSKLLKKE